MPPKIRHGLLISLVVISLIVVSFNTSYAETTNYVYDELNRLIRVEYEDGTVILYIYDKTGNRREMAIPFPDFKPRRVYANTFSQVRNPFSGGIYLCYRCAVLTSSKMFGFAFHIFIWPDDFYRKSSTPEACLC